MRRLGLLLLLVIATTRPVAAQQWSLEAQAGRIRGTLDPASSELQNLVLGARYDQNESALRVYTGVPTSPEQALWGSLSASHRLAFRKDGWVAGADLNGIGFLMQERARTREVRDVFNRPQIIAEPAQAGYAAAAQLMPLVGYEARSLQAYVRGGGSRYTSEFGEAKRSRSALMAEAQVVVTPVSTLFLAPVVRHYDVAEGAFTFAGITVGTGSESVSLWGTTGWWTNLEDQQPTWAAGATVRLSPRVSMSAAGRSDAFDPLYATPSQTSWNVGLSVKLGRIASGKLAAPAVFEGGRAVIELDASESNTPPRVAGDFTNWKAQPMQRRGDAWVYAATLAPGVYNYAFVDAAGKWFVPAKHPGRKQDGMGGEVAVLVVR